MTNNISQFHPTKYWHKLDNGRIQCDLCPHHCKLQEGQHGICFIRMCQNNQIVLATYGLTSGFYIDPIEKKPLNHFFPGSTTYSFGAVGCNLLCKYCQNWDISKTKANDALIYKSSPESVAQKAQEYGCKSIAFTYNEPIIFMEFAIDVAKEAHKLGIKTVAVTNGYICKEPRKDFFSYIDAARVDLKGFTEKFYKNITGSELQPVLETLIYLKKYTNIWLEIICLLIPGENDSSAEIDSSTKWVAQNLGVDVPVHFTAFHPAWKMLNKPSTPLATLVNAREIAIKNGLYYVYIGNIESVDGGKTFCHNCKKCIISRNYYNIIEYHLTSAGECKFCHAKCAGIFS